MTNGGGYTVTVNVDPSALIANSSTTAQITATVVDSMSQPISGVILSGVLNPTTLGNISGLGGTNANGQSFGTWAVDGAVTSGVLIVSDGTVTGTANLAATTGSLATISVSPNPVTVTAGSSRVFGASGFDQYGNPMTTAVAWTTNGGTIDATGTFTAATSAANGRSVIATQGSVAGTAVVNIVAGIPATLIVSPSTSVISAGMSVTYTAVAYDLYNNLIGDVTGSTVFNITPALGGTFVGNVVTPTIANTYLVTGTYGTISKTAQLTVSPAGMSRLAIENGPAGIGTPISTTSLSIYDTLTAYAAAYDRYNNLIGPVTAGWNATGILAGTLAPTTGISTTLTPAPILSGPGVISATYNGFTSTTGLITIQVPVLKISKTANANPVVPGDELEYTIIYTNVGSVTAQNVVITETYPTNTSYNLASPLPTSGDNVWSIGNLVPGGSAAIVVSLQVADSMPVGSVLTNVVTIGAAKSATAVYTLTTLVAASPLLNVSVADNLDPVRVGQSLVYSILYSNNGNSTAHGIRITETYPSEVTFESSFPPPALTPTVGSNVWLRSSLSPGGFDLILVTVRVRSPLLDLTSLNNQIAMTSVEQPTRTVAIESTLVESPIVALSKQANAPSPEANSLVTYTLLYTNSGSTYASSVVVTDAVPGNTIFQDCAPASCSYNPGTRVVTWNLGQVDSQDAQPLTMTAYVYNNLWSGTMLTNTARIVAAENVTASASLTNVVHSRPDLNLIMSNGVSNAAAGDILTYTLTYSNEGNSPGQSVVITDRIPSHTSFKGCSSACINMGAGAYSYTLGTVNASNGGVVTLSVKVDSPLPAGIRSITNTATITTTTPNADLSGHLAEDVDGITTVPVLALQASFDTSTPFEGKIITYTLRYTNTSAMDTTGVVISVTKSPYVTQYSPGWPTNGEEAIWLVGDLPAGASGIATYSVQLPLTLTQEMVSFVNRFVIADDGPGGLPIASTTKMTMVGVPDLVIDNVSLSPSIIPAGAKFTATVTIRNAGTARACNPNRLPCVGYQNGSPIGGFFVDVFLNPLVPPPSFPFVGYGDRFPAVAPLSPGEITTVVFSNLSFAFNQQPILYFKVDNYACPGSDCAPSFGQRGLVPESNEFNNVFGPVITPQFKLYLPLIRKTK
jgi:uncharacterized repeat protein (TIGR01451 family)